MNKQNNETKQMEEWVKIVERQEAAEKGYLLCEMAKAATFNGYDVFVWSDDKGRIPHFHVARGNPECPEFDCCIKFLSSEYFPHNGHLDKLSRKELKRLVELLQSKSQAAGNELTVWKLLIASWNMNNDRSMIPWTTPMPDYLHIVYPT